MITAIIIIAFIGLVTSFINGLLSGKVSFSLTLASIFIIALWPAHLALAIITLVICSILFIIQLLTA